MTNTSQIKQYAANTVLRTAPTLETLILPGMVLHEGMQHLAEHTDVTPQIAAYVAGAGLMGLYNWKGKELAAKLRDRLSTLPSTAQIGVHAALLGGLLATTQCSLPELPSPSFGTITVDDAVEQYIASLDLPESEGVSVYAHPIGKQDNAFVSINDDKAIRSASANKVYVMMAAYALTEPSTSDISLMIARSDNNATNRLIRSVGGEDAVNDYIESLGITDTTVRLIPNSGRTLDNVTTLRDLSSAYQMIYHEDVEHADDMISVLNDSPHRDRLVDNTCLYDGPGYKLGYRIDDLFHKTGSINGVNIDAGVVEVDFQGEIIPYFIGVSFDDPTVGSGRGYAERRSPYIRDISELVFANAVYPTYAGRPYMCRTHKGKHGVEQ